MSDARFTYACASCGSSVTKAPTGSTNTRTKTKAGLHGWSCSNGCGHGVKVVRKVN